MKKFFFPIATLAGFAAFGASAQAQELGRVISSTPVIQQVAVPRQVCSNQPQLVPQQKSGAGAVIGALAGGAMGNAIGDGGGRAAATILGLVGGALLGDRIEGSSGNQVQNVQQCTTQTFYENRTVAYNVTYEYAGKQYNVQMANDPGQFVRLQITPVSSLSVVPEQLPAQVLVPAQPVYAQSYVQQAFVQPIAAIQPSVVAVPYYRPYYPPVGVALNFGYSRGNHYRHRHGHPWR